MNDQCPICHHFRALREQAKRAGDYSKATDYEVLRRRHPAHTAQAPRQSGGPRA
ncbi:hypothetical protein SAZ11_19415 [Streptomyces sp. FXJ1.4098]|uniref:hypothetical protein n=1 Tax=Streptomyces sp. NPDC020845 TaxID=3365096 RepID=UPI002997670B|nr:hypothetical protein [Streptomyces sp. FXJ1.4098]